jgi:dihydropyrimidinase
MLDLVIRGGKVVLPDGVFDVSVGVDEGKIVAVGKEGSLDRAEMVVDASGKILFPGAIDPHIHIQMPFMGAVSKDNFFDATKAAAWGGTTSLITFATPQKGQTTLETVKKRREQADGNVVVDYSLHPTITSLTPETEDQVEEFIGMGLPSFKLFMVYRKEGIMADDGMLMRVFQESAEHGGLVGCHAENMYMIEYLREKAISEGNTDAIYHALTRPPYTEAETVNRALYMAELFRAPYYNFHLSIKEGVDMFRVARRQGRPVYAETCTHYLVNSVDDLRREDGINFICTPPLRDEVHREALWRGLMDGSLSLVSSDHCAFTEEMKKMGAESFDKVPNGMPGHEFRVPVMFSEGVVKRGMGLNRFADVVSGNAARIFGLYPRKGVIRVGSDADFMLIDPGVERTISVEDSLYGMDWYPCEGLTVKGWPVVSISKGKVLWSEGEFYGEAGDGCFLKRKIIGEAAENPMV